MSRIELKTAEQLVAMRRAGLVVAEGLAAMCEAAPMLAGLFDRMGVAFARPPEGRADLVRLPALGRVPALSRAPAVQVPLQVRLAQLEPRRAAVHDGADRGAVALAEGSDGEKPADGVPGQRVR